MFDYSFPVVATLVLALACSGKSEPSTGAGGQAKGGGAGTGAAGAPATAGSAPSGGVNGSGVAGEPGVVMGGTSPDGPCGGGAAPPNAGTGVIGGTWGNGGTDAGAGGAPDTIYLDCTAYQRCGVGLPACNCYSIPGCRTAICANNLCEACPGECLILDSYPGQIECQGASYVGIEPDDEGAALPICN